MIHSVYIIGWKYNEAKQLKQWQTEMVTAKAGTSVLKQATACQHDKELEI